MGLIDKISPKPKKAEGLSIEEAEFILAKLRLATYKGEEFEMFYGIFRKIGEHIKSIK
tara:strand:- start:7 stop:180 length:174 start_codon:yes stop_codon:yes gene_type:complete